MNHGTNNNTVTWVLQRCCLVVFSYGNALFVNFFAVLRIFRIPPCPPLENRVHVQSGSSYKDCVWHLKPDSETELSDQRLA